MTPAQLRALADLWESHSRPPHGQDSPQDYIINLTDAKMITHLRELAIQQDINDTSVFSTPPLPGVREYAELSRVIASVLPVHDGTVGQLCVAIFQAGYRK